MLSALVSIETQQENPTENNMKKVKQFLDYDTTNPNAIITYLSSDMILEVYINDSHLLETNAWSIAGGNVFKSSDSPEPPNNGAILTIAQINK